MEKNQQAEARMGQVLMSGLIQLAQNAEVKKYLSKPYRDMLPLFQGVPPHILKHNALVAADRPISALRADFEPGRFIEWLSGHGAAFFLKPKGSGKKKSLKGTKDNSSRVAAIKQAARESLSYSIREIEDRGKRYIAGEKFYQKALASFRDSIGDVDVFDNWETLVQEAKNIAEQKDALSMATLFFLKNANEVEAMGFDTGAYRQAAEEANPLTKTPSASAERPAA